MLVPIQQTVCLREIGISSMWEENLSPCVTEQNCACKQYIKVVKWATYVLNKDHQWKSFFMFHLLEKCKFHLHKREPFLFWPPIVECLFLRTSLASFYFAQACKIIVFLDGWVLSSFICYSLYIHLSCFWMKVITDSKNL